MALLAAMAFLAVRSQVTKIVINDPSHFDAVYKHKNEEKADDPKLECLYEYTAIDTLSGQTFMATTMLQVGQEWTKFQEYYDYWADSVCWRSDWKIKGYVVERMPQPDNANFNQSLLRHIATNRLTCLGNVGIDYYIYEDSTAQFKWTLLADTATVCGYPCRKAKAWFRGRQWEVWYTEEVPVDAGPWKFNGLPGLILRARTTDDMLMFDAVALRKPGAYYIARTFPERGDQRPTRETVLELEYNAARMTEQYLRSRVKVVSTSPGKRLPQRMFYQPLELE